MSCGLDICYCQSNSIIYNILYCFNTSHVTLYLVASSLLMMLAGFNTSHVTLYLKREEFFESLETSFNTSHVTLYPAVPVPSPDVLVTFQYISCYSLSEPEKLKIIDDFSFNTSHVTLYPVNDRRCFCEIMFQYISCYSLSVCFCFLFCAFLVSIHLMLLFIVLDVSSYQIELSFNTSHVTLYLKRFLECIAYNVVSIHLMLLFIIILP